MKSFKSLAAIAVAALAIPAAAHAGFNGDTVSLTFNNTSFTAPVVFAPSAVVGSGVEFTGRGTDVFGQIWDMTADISDNGLVFNFYEHTRANNPPPGSGNIWASNDYWKFDFTFTNSQVPTNMHLQAYTSQYPWGAQATLSSINANGHNLSVGFSAFKTTDNYVLTAVPEPETYAMVLAGLGLLGVAARRRKANSLN